MEKRGCQKTEYLQKQRQKTHSSNKYKHLFGTQWQYKNLAVGSGKVRITQNSMLCRLGPGSKSSNLLAHRTNTY